MPLSKLEETEFLFSKAKKNFDAGFKLFEMGCEMPAKKDFESRCQCKGWLTAKQVKKVKSQGLEDLYNDLSDSL